MRRALQIVLAVLFLAAAAHVRAEPAQAQGQPQEKQSPQPAPITVAILDYEVALEGQDELGKQIADILTVRLSIDDSIELVERAKLGRIIEEQKLKLIGLVNQDDAAKVGKLIGAKLLVMGKAFPMDKKLMIITKVVGVETGRVVGSLIAVELSKPASEMISLIAEDVSKLVGKHATKLLPKGAKLPDPMAEIRRQRGDKPAPVVAVIVTEEHIRRREPAPVADPAVETEIKKVLLACGYELVDTGQNELADWAQNMLKGKTKAWPAALAKADVVVVGEAFSEFALRTNDLVTCAARAEINVIDRHSGRILVADRKTTRAVDLAEAIAGKTALQQAGHKLGIQIARALTKYDKESPPQETKDTKPKEIPDESK